MNNINQLSKYPIHYKGVDYLVQFNKSAYGYWIATISTELNREFLYFFKRKVMTEIYTISEESYISDTYKDNTERMLERAKRFIGEGETDFVEFASWGVKRCFNNLKDKLDKENNFNKSVKKFKEWDGNVT